jgi:tRNA(Ile)-lysidine synthase TilS/MesJ
MEKKLCKKCILPENYVGLSLDENGICNFCNNYKKGQYLGKEKLLEKINTILSKNPERTYDCVVGLSGGRDSSFLLWYVVHELKLKPLAIFVDSGLIPEQTIKNVNETVSLLKTRDSYITEKR